MSSANSSNNYLVIRDSLHGDIKLEDPVLIALIDTAEFQRLRRIRQMSGAALVFPGATHTRFMHSLGTYHLVKKILDNPSFQEASLSKSDIRKIQIAGLLHDVGHGPLSHTFEQIKKINHSILRHEDYSALIIMSPSTEIHQTLINHGLSVSDIQDIADFIANKKHPNVLSHLVNSQIDADRMDYLMRDDRHAGTGYGYTDVEYITRNMEIDLKQNQIRFPSKVLFSLENYLVGRYHMYSQVYHHPISVGYDMLFRSWFKRIYDLHHQKYHFSNSVDTLLIKGMCSPDGIPLDQYIALDDYYLYQLIIAMSKEPDGILQTLSQCLLRRHVFRAVSRETFVDAEQKFVERWGTQAPQYFNLQEDTVPNKIYDDKNKPIWIYNGDTSQDFLSCSSLLNQRAQNTTCKTTTNSFIIKEILVTLTNN